MARALAVLMLVAAASSTARAHTSSLTYVEIAVEGRTVGVTLQISNRDLYEAIGVDKDRAVDRAEVERARAPLLDYVAARVHVKNGEADCPPAAHTLSFADKSDGFFAVTRVDYVCKRTAADVTVEYDLFFDLDPMHQGLARVELPGQPERQHVFRGAARTLRLDRPVTLFDHLRDYCLLGMEHIFTGYDHLAFLFGLLLVATSRGLRGGTRYILGVVTAFTVAHSVTLIAAGLGWVRLPSRFVESAIALSIAYVAVENLAVREPKHRWLLTFCFGLVHGFGFASVLAEIGLPPSGVIPSLVSFNVGVELGQLTVVCLVAPILLWLVPRYRQSARVRTIGSAVLLVLSSYWFFERVLGRVWLRGWLG
ncbi:MAG: HupE/UreJ family protein [Polyangia bacterium]